MVAGRLHLVVPMGFVGELPVGVSFCAGPWSEPTLLGIGYAYEQATHARRPRSSAHHRVIVYPPELLLRVAAGCMRTVIG